MRAPTRGSAIACVEQCGWGGDKRKWTRRGSGSRSRRSRSRKRQQRATGENAKNDRIKKDMRSFVAFSKCGGSRTDNFSVPLCPRGGSALVTWRTFVVCGSHARGSLARTPGPGRQELLQRAQAKVEARAMAGWRPKRRPCVRGGSTRYYRVLTRRRGANAAHTQMRRPTH